MNRTVRVDVREDVRSGREPFSRIMGAAAALRADEELLVVAPFEPVPLFDVLGGQGFDHTSLPVGGGDFEVRFRRRSVPMQPPHSPLPGDPASAGEPGTQRLEVDARGLEPPQPLVRILEMLVRLPRGGVLDARTDRRPMHLYAQLEERGFTAETEEQPDGSFLTHVHHR